MQPTPAPINPVEILLAPSMLAKVKEWVVSMIRTIVGPYIGGIVLKWLIERGVHIDGAKFNVVVTLVLTGLWYGVFRAIEVAAASQKVRKIAGIFLGYAKPPVLRATAGAVIETK